MKVKNGDVTSKEQSGAEKTWLKEDRISFL